MALGLLGAAAAAAAPRPERWVYAFEVRGRTANTPGTLSLLRLDARTLSVRRRVPFERAHAGRAERWARSPDGRKLATLSGPLRIIDLDRLRVSTLSASDLGLPPQSYFWDVAWVSNDRVVAIAYRGGAALFSAAWIDVTSSKPVRVVDLPGRATDFMRARDHAFIALRPRARGNSWWRLLGGVRKIYRLGRNAASPISVIKNLRVGNEPWHVRRGAPLPPLAAQSLRQAREDLAQRDSVPVQAIESKSMVAFEAVEWDTGRAYRMYLRSPTRLVEYWATYEEGRAGSLHVSPPQTVRVAEPDFREHDLLRFPPGTRIVRNDALVANRERTTLYVVTDGRELGVIDLVRGTMRIKTVEAGRPMREFAKPLLVGDAAVAWLVDQLPQIAFLDLHSGRVRVRRIRSEDCLLAPASRLVLAFRCDQITAFDAQGRIRFSALRGEGVRNLQASDRYAYVTLVERLADVMFAVVDLRTGRVVRRLTFGGSVGLLVGSHPWPV